MRRKDSAGAAELGRRGTASGAYDTLGREILPRWYCER